MNGCVSLNLKLSSQKGISLLEVLVVLTLIAMISSVLFQGYAYMLGSYERIRERQMVELNESLVTGWWRSTLESVVPFYDDERAFSGTSESMQGASFSALGGRSGAAKAFGWSLQTSGGYQNLVYHEPPGIPLTVERWPANEPARFEYLNESGEWQLEWRVGEDRQIPEAIRLIRPAVAEARGGSADSITAVISIRKSQYIPSQVVMFGRE